MLSYVYMYYVSPSGVSHNSYKICCYKQVKHRIRVQAVLLMKCRFRCILPAIWSHMTVMHFSRYLPEMPSEMTS